MEKSNTANGTYRCSICGYVHNNSDTDFGQLPDDWVCPWCKAEKSAFVAEGAAAEVSVVDTTTVADADKKLTPLECSIVCSNLARGCDKQYLSEESQLLYKLAKLFCAKEPKVSSATFAQLQTAVDNDLSQLMPVATAVAVEAGDRGAQRALVWSTKVTTIVNSLLSRYASQGDDMVDNTNIYVCSICGFVYVGDSLPELCPICKVPNYKFDKIEGGN